MTILTKIETTDAPQAIGPYSQAMFYAPFMFVSGQLPLDPQTNKLVKNEILEQVNRVLDNLEAILKANGCTFQEVVRCDIFLKDLNDFAIVNQEYAKRFKKEPYPARQTVQVAKLPLDAMIEISCVAVKS